MLSPASCFAPNVVGVVALVERKLVQKRLDHFDVNEMSTPRSRRFEKGDTEDAFEFLARPKARREATLIGKIVSTPEIRVGPMFLPLRRHGSACSHPSDAHARRTSSREVPPTFSAEERDLQR
jgi:hypothetical protein